MMCCKNKFIFIHINKTGGSSITKLLVNAENPPQKHNWAWWYKKYKPTEFNTYFKFSIIRNPWDKLLSQYFFRVKDNTQHGYIESAKDMSFLDFLLNPFPAKHASQHSKLFEGDVCLVDFIGRFENLQEDFNTICDKIGVPQQELPHVNKTKHKHYAEYYDEETKQIVAEKYAKDIEYFGYKFGE